METFTLNTFKNVMKSLDEQNNYDMETFIDGLFNCYDPLYESDMEEILFFMSEDLDVGTDSEVAEMSKNDIQKLCDFINDLVAN